MRAYFPGASPGTGADMAGSAFLLGGRECPGAAADIGGVGGPVAGGGALPGRRLAKTRYSIPPLGIDVFDPPLHGLVTAEAEFGTDAEMLAFQPPGYVHAEITDDPRFTGGRLAVAPREDLISWLAQYGISPDDPDLNQSG